MCYYVANHFFFAETLKWVLQKRKWSKQKSTQRRSNKSAKAQNTDPSPLTPPPTHTQQEIFGEGVDVLVAVAEEGVATDSQSPLHSDMS